MTVVAEARISERVALLAETSRWEPERRRRWRETALADLLASARRSPFWAPRLESAAGELAALPPLTREELRDNLEAMRVPTGRPVLQWRTSGSTGRPVTVEQGADSLGYETAARRRQLAWFGLPAAPVGEVTVANRAPPDAPPLRRTRAHPPGFELNPWRLDARAIADGLRGAGVRIADGVPSQVARWAAVAEHGEQLGLELVIVGGEVVDPQDRHAIATAFEAPVVELYGAMEARAIACSCPHGHLHVNEEIAWLEIVGDDGAPAERGELLVTTLHNHELPLLRYRLGDRGAWLPGPCPCGSTLPRLDGLLGRSEEHVRAPDGELVHPRFLRSLYEAEFGDALVAFSTVQSPGGDLRAQLELRQPPAPGARERLEAGVAEHLGGPVALTLALGPVVPEPGKRRAFRRER